MSNNSMSDYFVPSQASNDDGTQDWQEESQESDDAVTETRKRPHSGEVVYEIELRALFKSKDAGIIIGKGGENIKRLRNEYSSDVNMTRSGTSVRVLTVKTQDAVFSSLLLDIVSSLSKDDDGTCELQLLVNVGIIGYMIGKGGSQIKALRAKTGANINLQNDHLPNSTDRIVSVKGGVDTVAGCIEEIVRVLKTAPPPKGITLNYNPANDSVMSHNFGTQSKRGNPSLVQTAVANRVRVLITGKQAGMIIGKAGSNIARLRKEYKCQVQIPPSGTDQRILHLSGEVGSMCQLLADLLPTCFSNSSGGYGIQLLLHDGFTGYVIGKGGSVIKSLRESTGVDINVGNDHLPESTDRPVWMSGTENAVIHCLGEVLELVARKGKNFVGSVQEYDPSLTLSTYPNRNQDYNYPPEPQMAASSLLESLSQLVNRNQDYNFPGMAASSLMGEYRRPRQMDTAPYNKRPKRAANDDADPVEVRNSGNLFDDPSINRSPSNIGGQGPQSLLGDRYNPVDRYDDIEQCFGGTQTTQFTVPNKVVSNIIGHGGERIRMIRVQSGAQVHIDGAKPNSDQRSISITGTREQVEIAQLLMKQAARQMTDFN